MAPTNLPPKHLPRPTRKIKVPGHAQESHYLASVREGTKKIADKKNHHQHRAQQEETMAQAQVHHSQSTQRRAPEP
ncbi:hypothetical protein FRC06_001420, partial [Ceratobasidium sp. 370]